MVFRLEDGATDRGHIGTCLKCQNNQRKKLKCRMNKEEGERKKKEWREYILEAG